MPNLKFAIINIFALKIQMERERKSYDIVSNANLESNFFSLVLFLSRLLSLLDYKFFFHILCTLGTVQETLGELPVAFQSIDIWGH